MKMIFEKWWKRNTKVFAIINYKRAWKEHGIKPTIRIHSNRAKRKNGDTCFDLTIFIRYTVFTYTNFDLQRKVVCDD